VAQTDILASASPVDAATEEALIQALPRSLQAAMEASEQARVITESRAPFRIVHVNKAWEGLCGFSQAEAVGKSLDILQGARTKSSGEFKRLESHLQGEPKGISVRLVNYTKAGRPFVNQLRVVPLHEGSDEVTHMLGVLEDVSFSHSKNQQAAI
jgi:PAS domain S-box-containing protein